MGSLGENYYLEISGLKDVYGQFIPSDWGNRFLIQILIDDLDNIVVFPNPYREDFTESEIMFGGIPNGTEIYIYTANSRLVKMLTETDYNGGICWNLQNEMGEEIKSGVYIYVAQFLH